MKGLKEYNYDNRIFQTSILYQLLFSTISTGIWYYTCQNYRVFSNKSNLFRSLPLAFLGGLYFTKGFSNQLVAMEKNSIMEGEERLENYYRYKTELRNKNIIQ